MCGIVAAFNHSDNKKPVNTWIVDQLQDQLGRGKEGFGIAFINDKGIVQIERSTEITKTLLDLRFIESRNILLHHRFPTSSENKLSQTHPILVNAPSMKNQFLVVHNGVLRNEDELREQHEELGFKYSTLRTNRMNKEEFNDSEALAIEVARFIEGDTKQIGAIGSVAFIAIEFSKKGNKALRVHFGRNSGNPLHMSNTRGKLRLSSEGEGDLIPVDIMYSASFKNFKLSKRKCVIQASIPLKVLAPTHTPTSLRNSFHHGTTPLIVHGATVPQTPYHSNSGKQISLAQTPKDKDVEFEEVDEIEPEDDDFVKDYEVENIMNDTLDNIYTHLYECIETFQEDIDNEIKHGGDTESVRESFIDSVAEEVKEMLHKAYAELSGAMQNAFLAGLSTKEDNDYEEAMGFVSHKRANSR